jgi:hypothetical protein
VIRSVFVSYRTERQSIVFYVDAIVHEFVVVLRFYDPTPPTNPLTDSVTHDSIVNDSGFSAILPKAGEGVYGTVRRHAQF